MFSFQAGGTVCASCNVACGAPFVDPWKRSPHFFFSLRLFQMNEQIDPSWVIPSTVPQIPPKTFLLSSSVQHPVSNIYGDNRCSPNGGGCLLDTGGGCWFEPRDVWEALRFKVCGPGGEEGPDLPGSGGRGFNSPLRASHPSLPGPLWPAVRCGG